MKTILFLLILALTAPVFSAETYKSALRKYVTKGDATALAAAKSLAKNDLERAWVFTYAGDRLTKGKTFDLVTKGLDAYKSASGFLSTATTDKPGRRSIKNLKAKLKLKVVYATKLQAKLKPKLK